MNTTMARPRHNRVFTNDVDELAASFRGGLMRYVQQRPGRKPTEIHDLHTPLVNLRHATFGQAMTTISDDGVKRIGFVISLQGQLNGCGQATSANNLVHYDIEQGVQLRVPAEGVFVSGSIDRDLALSLCEQHGYRDLKGIGGPRISPVARARLIEDIRAMTLEQKTGGMSDRQIQDDFGLALLRATDPAAGGPLLRSDRRRLIVRKTLETIEAHYDRDLTVTELCRVAQTTERTLRYAFVSLVGMSAQRYLMQWRLHMARMRLRTAEHGISVSTVASACGFRHQGRFAAYFHEMFGELPNSLLRD